MALHVPRAPGFSSMLKDGARFFSGLEEAVLRNVEACEELSESVRTAYGPLGMSKMVINHIGKLFVTSDAATILRELEVQHPAAKMLLLAAQAQEQEVGDGTNWVMIFSGALLHEARELIKMGLKPVEVAAGYERALGEALKILPTLVVDEVKAFSDIALMKQALRPSLMSKQYGQEDILASLVAEACVSILPEKNTTFNVDNVRVVKILSGSVSQSQLVQGMVFRRGVEGDVSNVDNPKIACYTCPFDVVGPETKGTVLIQTAAELTSFSQGEEEAFEKVIKEIKAAGVTVVVAGGKFGDLALHLLNKHSIMAVRLTSKFDLRRICRTVGATALPKLIAPGKEEIGSYGTVKLGEVGDTPVVIFESGQKSSRVVTIVLRGATNNYLDDMERAVDDAVNTFKALTRDGRLLAGAGACELALAVALTEIAQGCPTLEQYSIGAFAEALKVFAKTLAGNCGANPTQVLAALIAAHEKGNADTGFNVEGDSAHLTLSAKSAGITDMFVAKEWGLKYATQAAATVLKVDNIIMAKQAGGGPKAREGGPMDQDDD